MLYYLFRCRSLTYAQRTAAALGRAGITSYIMRSPKSVAGEGCSHCVKVSRKNVRDALRVLRLVGLYPAKLYLAEGDGIYREVFADDLP